MIITPVRMVRLWVACMAGLVAASCLDEALYAAAPPEEPVKPTRDKQGEKWTSLFDGKSLKGWEVTNFGGEGEVRVENGSIILERGSDLTGIHTKRKLPRINYEVELEAMRVDGGDFFCGLTFPVKDAACSLILGGWGGGVCGLSSLDGLDASENETTCYRQFESKKWYPIRLRVTDDRITAWIEEEKLIDQDIKGKKISTRVEVEPSKPFGIASWQTTAALRKIRIRELEQPLPGDK